MARPSTDVDRQSRFSRTQIRLRRKVLVFSFSCALITLLFGGLIFSLVEIGIPLSHLREANQKTIEKIPCEVSKCDVSAITNDWEFAPSDYVLDKKTYFLLNIDQPAAEIPGFPSVIRTQPS
jgi:hypothetical protein